MSAENTDEFRFAVLVPKAVVLLLNEILPLEVFRPIINTIVIERDWSKKVGVQYLWSWTGYEGSFWQWGIVHSADDAFVFLSQPHLHAESICNIKREYGLYERRQREELVRSLFR